MSRPVFVCDTTGELEIIQQASTEDFEAIAYFEAIDVEAGEYTAFDIDGRRLDLVAASQDLRARYHLRGDAYLLVATGIFDLPGLLVLATPHAESIGYSLAGEDPLLDLANHDKKSDWAKATRPRWPRWRDRRVTRETFEPYSRS